MSGNAFVVSNCLIVDERALGEIGSGYDDAAGALTVRRTGDVVRSGGGLECGDGFDSDRRLWKKSEELGKFRLHLSDVTAEIVEDLIGGRWNIFWIGLN